MTGVRVAAPFLVRTTDPPVDCPGRPHRHRAAPSRQAHRHRRRRHGGGGAPDDRRDGCAGCRPDRPSPDASAWRRWISQHGSLVLTEAGSTRRASLHMVHGAAGVAALDPGGLEPLAADLPAFRRATGLRAPHAQARAHRPVAVQRDRQRLLGRDPAPRRSVAAADVRCAVRRPISRGCSTRRSATLDGVARRAHRRDRRGFPERVTAFRPGMRVHGRFGQPCPAAARRCSGFAMPPTKPTTARRARPSGRLLADRGLSRLLKGDWPRTARGARAPQARRR